MSIEAGHFFTILLAPQSMPKSYFSQAKQERNQKKLDHVWDTCQIATAKVMLFKERKIQRANE